MMALNSKQRSYLRGQAHKLDPVAFMGLRGVTPEFLAEVDRNLKDHELIKVRIACDDQAELKECVDEIMGQTRAEMVQVIGHILVLYRQPSAKLVGKGKSPKYKLPQ